MEGLHRSKDVAVAAGRLSDAGENGLGGLKLVLVDLGRLGGHVRRRHREDLPQQMEGVVLRTP